MNSKWLSQTLDNSLIENPNLKLLDIHNKTAKKWNTKVTISMALRAKQLAAKVVEGSFKDQCKRIYDYAQELHFYMGLLAFLHFGNDEQPVQPCGENNYRELHPQ